MSDFENQVLEFFDKCPTRQQIRSLAMMYAVPESKIIEILERNDRECPTKKRGPKPKAKGLKADIVIIDEAAAPEPKKETITKMPDCVAKTIEKRMHELESDIKNYQNTIRNYQDMIHKLEAEYTAHADYLLHGPLVEQGNLSHSCSDNMIESPQPIG